VSAFAERATMMKRTVIAIALITTIALPAKADPMHLLDAVSGVWAIDGDCDVKSKTYFASVSDSGETIVWQDGLGNVDKEAVIWIGESEFRTITIASVHGRRAGHRLGTGWTYSAFGSFNSMQITRTGGTFYVSRCN
jgi:hypothetical protein